MILVHGLCPKNGDRIESHLLQKGEELPAQTLWIDLVEPTREEDLAVERHLQVSIPTREDVKDIEPSELLYTEEGSRVMTARVVCKADTEDPKLAAISFITKGNTLVTVRYDEPRSFPMYVSKATKPGGCTGTAEAVLVGLLETVIDRIADILQETGDKIDQLSRGVFQARGMQGGNTAMYESALRDMGRHGDLISKSRESLVSIERMMLFLSASFQTAKVAKDLRDEVKTVLRDIQSLEEHATFQSSKIQFLLDATLGLVNLEQNNIIKLFSVMAVIFMPPTLVASIYGMNFKEIPELSWAFGYPYAIGLMIFVGMAPYFFFRWKRWL